MSDEVSTATVPTPSFLPPNFVLPPAATQLVDRFGGKKRLGILGIGVAAVVMILTVARWATAPGMVPLFAELPLESVGPVTERLDEQGIPYTLGGDGSTIEVSSVDLARARVATAGEGMPASGRPGLEIFDKPSWGMTDFTQRVNYRRAMEGELERTIGKMRDVEAVKVHVAMEETTGFRRDGAPSEASVVIKLRRGTSPSPEMVQGISHLVASSIDGIEAEHVMVLDDTGRLLSDPYEEGSSLGVASRELKMRNEIEQYLSKKAEGIVGQIVGPGNVRIQVSAELNLDRVERTVETVDPDRQVLASEQRSEIIPGAEGGAGSRSVTSTYLNTRSVETYSGAVGSVRRITAAILVNDKPVVDETGMTYEARTPEELAQIETLVSNAMGIDTQRGDIITIVSFPFDGGFTLDAEPTFTEMALRYQRPALGLIALIATIILAFRITRTLKTPELPAAEETAKLGAGKKGEKLDRVIEDGEVDAEALAAMSEAERQAKLKAGLAEYSLRPGSGDITNKDLVAAQIDAAPDVAAKLIRTWMRED